MLKKKKKKNYLVVFVYSRLTEKESCFLHMGRFPDVGR